MKPAPFEYIAATSLEQALSVMAEHGFDAKLLAGGQSLIPVMNFRLAQPTLLVDLNPVESLSYITPHSGGLRVGAMARHSHLEKSALVAHYAPLIHQTMPLIAHPQIRNRGTVGGSLAHADPAGELPVLTVALEARFKLQKVGGERWVSAETFYQSLFTTALADDEILTEIDIPKLPARTGVSFHELARRHGDYAQCGVAAIVTLDETGICQRARLVYLNVGDIPMVAHEAMAMLVGNRLEADVIATVAAHAAAHEIAPASDVHASAAYKRHLAQVLTKRALNEAATRA